MSTTNVLFLKICVAPGAAAPCYAKPGDAGADLALDLSGYEQVPDGVSCSKYDNPREGYRAMLMPGEAAWFQTGVSFELPDGVEGQVRPRSSAHNLGLLVGLGTIDSGYRGPVGVHLRNVGSEPIELWHGQRVAQIVFSPVYSVRFSVVPALSETVRGTSGFGSSGQ
jgi:dUTP pyrophosphatase